MQKKEKTILIIVYLLTFLLAIYMDIKQGKLEAGEIIYRNDVGEDEIDVELLLEVDGVFENHSVDLTIEPRKLTANEAEKYFKVVTEKIDKDFEKIDSIVPIKKNYEKGIIKAKWSFSPVGYIGIDGIIDSAKIPEEGMLFTATVVLQSGTYEKVYQFPFFLDKPVLSPQEKVEQELSAWFDKQQNMEGESVFQLPKEIAGYSLEWKEKGEYLTVKILILEILSVVLLFFARKKEKENAEKKKYQQREIVYPELINQLLILLEAGMTTRQAWRRIAIQYAEKRKQKLVEESEVYNAIVQMDKQLSEGEKERIAYENFMNQMELMSYRRLMRLLINNLEKGNRDICVQLSLEAKQAYDKRLLLAKKLGEEASTKMLIPMMLMMVLIMVIVMAPAIMGIQI